MAVELSYCIVSTQQRQLLRYCLDAVARERAAVPFDTEVLVLDNASHDGSASTALAHPATTEVIAAEVRRGRAANHSDLLRLASGRFCLLLQETSELEPGATAALHEALSDDEQAGAAGATLVEPDGTARPSAWRFPGVGTALLDAAGLHRFVVQSRGGRTRRVDWCPPAAMLVRRRAAAAVGWLDPAFFLSADAPDFCRRLADAAWHVLWVPQARAVNHPPTWSDEALERWIVERARNRERYLRKHHSGAAARTVGYLEAARHGTRALLALARRNGDSGAEARRAAAVLSPGRGEGLAEEAAAHNRALHE